MSDDHILAAISTLRVELMALMERLQETATKRWVYRSATNRQLATLASSSTRRFDRKLTSRFVLSYVVMPRERRRRT